jgi:hypothetical protein
VNKKKQKNFFDLTVLVSRPQAQFQNVFAPLFSKSGFFLHLKLTMLQND